MPADPAPTDPLAAGPAAAAVEAALHDPTALWDAVCRVTGDYIVVIDPSGTLRVCNRAGDGYTPDQVIGRGITDFTVPESAARLQQAILEVFATGEPRSLETTVRGIGGEMNFFSLRLGPVLHEGRTAAVMACCENILQLKTSERTLQHERNVLRRLLEIQERERQLVSYEIHDGLAQYLAGAIMHLEAYRHSSRAAGEAAELTEGIRLLQAAAEESRRLISGLRPPSLDELGIIEAIESLVAEARTEIPDVVLTHALPGQRLPASLETAIFRIVQESLSNARKHAEPRRVRIDVSRCDGHVRVRVEDDGRGFDPAHVPEDRFGLEGIRQRSRLLNAEPRIASSPGQGTTIEVVFPVPSDQPRA